MTNALQNLSNEITTIIEAVSPAIVRVEGRRRLGSTGVVWSGEGIVVTAHHTLERDEDIQIGLIDGRVIPATLVGRDPRTDLAVLRVEDALPTTTWHDNTTPLQVGHLALALGRPSADVQASLGIIRAIHENHIGENRPRRGEHPAKRHGGRRGEHGAGRGGRRHGGWHRGPSFSPIVHTDITLYPGFSGGPLLDTNGVVRGINTSGMFRNTNLLIPVNTVRSTVEALLSHGRIRRAYLGVAVQPVHIAHAQHENAGQDGGLIVFSVEADSPAEKAGVLQGDILLSVNDTPLYGMDDLLQTLNTQGTNAAISLKLLRAGKIKTVKATIGERA